MLIDYSFSSCSGKNLLGYQHPPPHPTPQLLTNPSNYVGHKGVGLAARVGQVGDSRGGSFCCFCETNENNCPLPPHDL